MLCVAVLQCVVVCCGVLRCVAVDLSEAGEIINKGYTMNVVCCGVLQCVAVCCSVW